MCHFGGCSPRRCLAAWLLLAAAALLGSSAAAGQPSPTFSHFVAAGDTWPAIAWRYVVDPQALRQANPHPNRQWQPAIGSAILVPGADPAGRNGRLIRRAAGGLLALGLETGRPPWHLALQNGRPHPYRPLLGEPLFVSGGESPPSDLPAGLESFELSSVPALPGRAIALRGRLSGEAQYHGSLAGSAVDIFSHEGRLVGLAATGAFFRPGDHELAVWPDGGPLWSQPLRFSAGEWISQTLTLTGGAAEIDQAAIDAERERMFEIWNQRSRIPQWINPFQLPMQEFIGFSSPYGARRSYNGGPFRTYHEGVDFNAEGGAPVRAPAGGTVVLAEQLYVRGGAVIIDHGLGIYSGLYHLSEVIARPGKLVAAGDLVGRVGTTGLSTGNHLHWDLLVAGYWVDGLAWNEEGLACWVLAGWGQPCAPA
ncbi:MAG: peptidoglycan DD-metalloendopeptidase family protein [Candidatus Promineifilaceae bacterium]